MLNKGPAKLLSLFALIFLFYLFFKTQEQGKILEKHVAFNFYLDLDTMDIKLSPSLVVLKPGSV
jgi:hypothetical protein